nr:phasin [Methylosinus sp. Sm6]
MPGRWSRSAGPAPSSDVTGRKFFVNEPIFQIPNEVRDFAEKSMEQARKAFEGYAGAAQKAISSLETTTSSFQTGATDVSAKALGYAEANVNAAFELARKLLHAKDPQEVLTLQTEYVKTQVESIQSQAKELGSALQKATTGR